jgi:hypothetical protein
MVEKKLFNYQTNDGISIFIKSKNLDGAELSVMSAAYQEAFEVLCEKLIHREPKNFHPFETIIFPALFLFRHCCEISLKELIDIAEKCLNLKKSKKLNHDLLENWERCKELLDQIEKKYKFSSIWTSFNYDEVVLFVENIVKELDHIDKTSESFRYAVGKDGSSLLENLDFVDINNIYELGKNFFNELKAFHLAILFLKKSKN